MTINNHFLSLALLKSLALPQNYFSLLRGGLMVTMIHESLTQENIGYKLAAWKLSLPRVHEQ